MGSQDDAAEPSQQLVFEQQSAGRPSPVRTRFAASPYFSWTISFTSGLMGISLFAAEDFFRPHSLVPGTTFGVEEAEKLLQCLRIGRVPEVGAFAPDAHQV